MNIMYLETVCSMNMIVVVYFLIYLLKIKNIFYKNMDKVIKEELFLEDSGLGNRRQQLEILISSGRCKELLNKDLNLKVLEQMKGKDVEKCYKMYESAMASKVS